MAGMSRRKPRAMGRPTALTPDVEEKILEQLRVGIPAAHAAPVAGAHRDSFYNWMKRGEDAADERDAGRAVDPREQRFLDFFDAATRARAEGKAAAVRHVAKSAEGGFVLRETTRRFRGPDGEVVTETDTQYAPPDWRAASWFLERADREHWSKTTEVEVSGPGGSPIAVGVAAFEALALRLRANMDRAAGELPAGGPVIEGEVHRGG